jgi:hypothetical protein
MTKITFFEKRFYDFWYFSTVQNCHAGEEGAAEPRRQQHFVPEQQNQGPK